jgi:N,N'-diacetyllegionaminate synthase
MGGVHESVRADGGQPMSVKGRLRDAFPGRPATTLPDRRCIVIGEVAQAHDGSLGMAHSFIDAISSAGADAVKFQTHIASAESTPAEPWRVRFSRQDGSRYDYWKRMEFTEDEWRGLREHADERGLWFLSSPFSIEAVQLLNRVGVAAWKIASGEAANKDLLARVATLGQPVLLSTGMSPLGEIDQVVEQLRSRNVAFAVMQCTSAYPCPPEKVGLNMIPFFRGRYDCPVGLSDHSGTIYPGLAATVLGIEVLEVHVTLSREMFGPDVPVSVTTTELRQLIEGMRWIESMVEHPVNKNTSAEETAGIRALFTRSVVARSDLPAGTILRPEHLVAKKPGTGILAGRLPELIGRKLKRGVESDALLNEGDLEDPS